jgi:hypothetical protein
MVFLRMGHCSQASSFASRVAGRCPPSGKMFEGKRLRCVALAYEKITKIGGFVQAVLTFSAYLKIFGFFCDVKNSHPTESSR